MSRRRASDSDPLLGEFNALLDDHGLPTLAALDETTTSLLVGLFECLTCARLPLDDMRSDRRRTSKSRKVALVSTLLEHVERTGLRVAQFDIDAAAVVAGESRALRRVCRLMVAVARLLEIRRDQTTAETSSFDMTSCSTPLARTVTRSLPRRRAMQRQQCDSCRSSILDQTSICGCDSTILAGSRHSTPRQFARQQSPARHHVRMPSSPRHLPALRRQIQKPVSPILSRSHDRMPYALPRSYTPPFPSLEPRSTGEEQPRFRSVTSSLGHAEQLRTSSMASHPLRKSSSLYATLEPQFDVDAYYGVKVQRTTELIQQQQECDDLPDSPGTAYIRQRHEAAVYQFQFSSSSSLSHSRGHHAQSRGYLTHARHPSTLPLARSTNSDKSFYIPTTRTNLVPLY